MKFDSYWPLIYLFIYLKLRVEGNSIALWGLENRNFLGVNENRIKWNFSLINPLFEVTLTVWFKRKLDRPIMTWKSKSSVKNTWGLPFSFTLPGAYARGRTRRKGLWLEQPFSRIQSAKWKFTPYLIFTPYLTTYLPFMAELNPPASRGLENYNPWSKIIRRSEGCR